jgi:FAD synthase
MQIHFSNDQIPEISFPVVTMGSFDGVHAGHRVIISRLNSLASQVGGSSVLITFFPHPRKVLYPDTAGKDLSLITTLDKSEGLDDSPGFISFYKHLGKGELGQIEHDIGKVDELIY